MTVGCEGLQIHCKPSRPHTPIHRHCDKAISFHVIALDCFVAAAPRNDGVWGVTIHYLPYWLPALPSIFSLISLRNFNNPLLGIHSNTGLLNSFWRPMDITSRNRIPTLAGLPILGSFHKKYVCRSYGYAKHIFCSKPPNIAKPPAA